MNKFWAKVNFKQEKNAEHLIRAFFQNFDPSSSIVVRGKEAKLEIFFQQPPIEIIDAICHCEVIELNYGENLKEYKEAETMQGETENYSDQTTADGGSFEQDEQLTIDSNNGEQTEQLNTESENSKKIELPKKKIGRPSTKKFESTKETKSEPAIINIPKLEEIAKKAISFEHFANLVAEWLEMDKRQEFFTNLIIVSSIVDKITWKELKTALKSKNVLFTQWDITWSGLQVSEKLKKSSVTLLKLLNATRQYKDYSFNDVDEHFKEEYSNKQTMERTTTNIGENLRKSDENVSSKPRVKMECMPEVKAFEETLARIDKTQPVEKRVRYVLEAMELNKLPVNDQKTILEIANATVKKSKIISDINFGDTNIPIDQRIYARMTFSKFVNDFVQKYDSSKKVKLLTFLSELQKVIMLENEIEKFSTCTD